MVCNKIIGKHRDETKIDSFVVLCNFKMAKLGKLIKKTKQFYKLS